MNDIKNRDDIVILVNAFYGKVREDELLAPVFNERIPAEKWPIHLERMYGFWNSVLFFQKEYKGNPFAKHIDLPINPQHFERWVTLFKATISENFEGPEAEDMKRRAENMGAMFMAKLAYIGKNPNFSIIQ